MRRLPETLLAILLLAGAGCAPLPGPMPGTEGSDSAAPPRGESVAVWTPEPGGLVAPESVPFLTEMAPALAGEIMSVFSESDDYALVEREKLLLALEELNLGSSELASPETRLEIGRLIGAKWMVFGVYQAFGDVLRLDLRRVSVETGRVARAASETAPAGAPGRWPAAARAAAVRLLESAAAPLSK
jgi:hypothetical protein